MTAINANPAERIDVRLRIVEAMITTGNIEQSTVEDVVRRVNFFEKLVLDLIEDKSNDHAT